MATTTYLSISRERASLHRRQADWLRHVALPGFLAGLAAIATGQMGFLGLVAGLVAIASVPFFAFDPTREAGMEGEEAVLGELMTLPEEFHLFNQVLVPNPRSRTGYTEVDYIVVGPTGVFVVEVKNNRGTIHGRGEQDASWPVEKVGRGGTPYWSRMRNPVRQAKGQAIVLGRWLREQGVSAWVQPVVVLAHPDVMWRPARQYSVPVVELFTHGARGVLTTPGGRAAPQGTVRALSRLRSGGQS